MRRSLPNLVPAGMVRPHLGILLICNAAVLYQLALLRVFSFVFWHHFAFMVLSVALLGLSAAGAFVHYHPPRISADRLATRACTGFALSAGISMWVAARLPFDPTHIGETPLQLLWLGVVYAVMLVPFTCAGLASLCLLRGYTDRVHTLYAADLVGAGLAAPGALLLLPGLGAEGLALFACAEGLLAAAVLVDPRGPAGKLLGVSAVLLGLSAPALGTAMMSPPGASKALVRFLDRDAFPQAALASTHWNAISRVDVVEGSGIVRWLQNPQIPVATPELVEIVIDGDAATPLLKDATDREAMRLLDHSLPAIGYRALRPDHVLIIGAGGGADVASALRFGAEHIDAIEVNPAIVDLVTGRYADYSGGLFAAPQVHLHRAEGRAYLSRYPEQTYDLIQLSLIDSWAALASGAYSLAESYLYTREAFESYVDHLGDDGVLAISRWMWWPPRELLKLFATAVEVLRARGVEDVAAHIVVVSGGPFGSLLVKATPFTEAELLALAQDMVDNGFEASFAPLGTARMRQPFADLVDARSLPEFYDSYVFDVQPATDSRPFFFDFGRLRDANPFGDGWDAGPLVLSGRLVLIAVLLQVLLITAVVFVGARFRRARPEPSARTTPALWPVLYFGGIGVSFMLVETALMQQFTLFLGAPLIAVAWTLSVLLVSAGLGSLLSMRIAARRYAAHGVFAAIVLSLLACAVGLAPAMGAGIHLSLGARLLSSIPVLACLGVVLGVPMAVGLRRFNPAGSAQVTALAWAANGVGSVLGPILSGLLAIELGLSAVLAIGAAVYGLAWLTLSTSSPTDQPQDAPAR